MLYVQQSLGPDEEILRGAEFHWMYNVSAALWIAYGVIVAIGIAWGGVWLSVDSGVREVYTNLPPHLYDQAWNEIVASKGGYLKIFTGLNKLLRIGMLVSVLVGIFLFVNMLVIKATTEIAITNQRLIYKRGLIARHVGELGVDSIEGVAVRQGIPGRIFGYGRVSVRGMGVGEVVLPPIDAPIKFRRAIQEAQAYARNRHAPPPPPPQETPELPAAE